jgi:hypothetical protein
VSKLTNTDKSTEVIQSIGESIHDVQGDVIFEKINQIANQTIIQGEISFEEIELQEFKKSLPIEEQEISQLASNNFLKKVSAEISDQHLLFIGKDRKVRKTNVARAVVYLSEGDKVYVRESTQAQNSGLALQKSLRKIKSPSIFILSDVKFDTFGLANDDFVELERQARKNSHYIIVTTDESKAEWEIGGNFLFYESIHEHVQDCSFLINTLSEEKLFEKWYTDLDKKHQIIAIALSLFDGVYGDQLFSATEKIAQSHWSSKIPEIQGIDYCDLKPLKPIFSLYNKSKDRESAELISARERYLVLRNAWKLHRRQVIHALPVLEEIVKESTVSDDCELYGNEERKVQIRLAISEAISNIGLLSQDSKVTEEILLALASSQSIQIQAVAASALAKWRSPDKRQWLLKDTGIKNERKMIETLNRWQEESQVKSFLTSLSKDSDYKESNQSFDFVRATVALSLGYSSELDTPEHMPEESVELFKRLISDENLVVQDRVLSDTLPRILRRHTRQISNEIKDLLRKVRPELILGRVIN